jgi:hypothetical protein
MAMDDLAQRRARYLTLSSELAHVDNHALRSRFDAAEMLAGWGRNHVLEIGASKVFVKRLPVTELEFDNLFSTRNLFALPMYYNYGVGSAGFGIFRELVANIKTTNWVLEGAVRNFPLLYHYRIIPFAGERPDPDKERLQKYVEYWNSNEHVGRYMLERANANYELVLFLEHIPYPAEPWLRQHPDKIDQVLADLRDAISFLRSRGIVHFDANFDNVLTDGEHTYLTDFGLVLDARFDLAEDEAMFLKQQMYYDYGEVLGSVGFLLYGMYQALSESDKQKVREKIGGAESGHADELAPLILKNVETLRADGTLNIDQTLLATIEKYRSVIMLTLEFFAKIRRNKRKDTTFPHDELVRLLYETEFLSKE